MASGQGDHVRPANFETRIGSVTITIPSFETRTCNGKKFTTFCVAVVVEGSQDWTVYRRYSQFSALHNALPPQLREKLNLPKKRFKGNFKPVFLETRRAELEAYMMQLLSTPGLNEEDGDVGSFLGMDLHVMGGGNPVSGGKHPQNRDLTEFNWVHRTGGFGGSNMRTSRKGKSSPSTLDSHPETSSSTESRRLAKGGASSGGAAGGSSGGACVLL